jgi:sulfoxide reductase catalytic subunit YedY
LTNLVKGPYSSIESVTPYKTVTTYNNFLEFDIDQGDASKRAANFPTLPWSVSVEGEVARPRTFTINELVQLAPLEERIYPHRCVEAWSIVVPWIGYSFNVLAKLVQPTANAKYVAFQSYYDPKQMPLAKNQGAEVPYLEGLRLDEAMHPLALLCVGMYGETLPNQDGAPVRMVIPWKYGYKSAKSLVKIRFASGEPPTTWNKYSPGEYGFYSNVNPSVQTRRYSQATERRLDGTFFGKNIKTTIFNGYADQVANLYTGMDLRKYH